TSTKEARKILGDEYRLLKHRYRLSDYKYNVPVLDDAREVLATLRKRGDIVYVSTSRPFSGYPEMKRQTIQWLTEAGVEFDGLVEKTPESLIEKKCDIHVDDEIETVILLEESGIRCVLYDRKQSLISQSNPFRVISDLRDLIKLRPFRGRDQHW
ncbi:unnamed protein product, partial [marine sediment metagenome]